MIFNKPSGFSGGRGFGSPIPRNQPTAPFSSPSTPAPTGANGIAGAFQGVNPARAGYDVGTAAVMANQRPSQVPMQSVMSGWGSQDQAPAQYMRGMMDGLRGQPPVYGGSQQNYDPYAGGQGYNPFASYNQQNAQPIGFKKGGWTKWKKDKAPVASTSPYGNIPAASIPLPAGVEFTTDTVPTQYGLLTQGDAYSRGLLPGQPNYVDPAVWSKTLNVDPNTFQPLAPGATPPRFDPSVYYGIPAYGSRPPMTTGVSGIPASVMATRDPASTAGSAPAGVPGTTGGATVAPPDMNAPIHPFPETIYNAVAPTVAGTPPPMTYTPPADMMFASDMVNTPYGYMSRPEMYARGLLEGQPNYALMNPSTPATGGMVDTTYTDLYGPGMADTRMVDTPYGPMTLQEATLKGFSPDQMAERARLGEINMSRALAEMDARNAALAAERAANPPVADVDAENGRNAAPLVTTPRPNPFSNLTPPRPHTSHFAPRTSSAPAASAPPSVAATPSSEPQGPQGFNNFTGFQNFRDSLRNRLQTYQPRPATTPSRPQAGAFGGFGNAAGGGRSPVAGGILGGRR